MQDDEKHMVNDQSFLEMPESAAPESAASESVASESVASESVALESAASESAASESAAPESVAPKSVLPPKKFIELLNRPDAKWVKIMKVSDEIVKFKLRTSNYLYTLTIKQAIFAPLITESIPQSLEVIYLDKRV